MNTDKLCAVVTGASSGIGRATALLLARRGLHVFAGVRGVADGTALMESEPARVTPLQLDVRRQESIDAAMAEVAKATEKGERFAGLVNNAGIPLGGPLEALPVDLFREQLEVNLMGSLAVTQSFLPLLRDARGRIVNISSISGSITFPYVGPYAASKSALNVLTDALRLELRPWGISVVNIVPGRVKTPLWGKAADVMREAADGASEQAKALYSHFFDSLDDIRPRGVPPDRVAEAVAHALLSARPKARYVVGRDAHLLLLLSRLPRKIRDALILSLARKRS